MSPKRVPIAAAKRLAEEQGCTQVIVAAWDGELAHVVTYGSTKSDCEQAAQGGNVIKRMFGFPKEMCNAYPARAGLAVPVAWRWRWRECDGAPWGEWHVTDTEPEPSKYDGENRQVQALGVVGP